jgi:drug/metabolite transporter (DMT)-like permease
VVAVSVGPAEPGHRPSARALGLAFAAGAAIAVLLVCLAKSPHDSGLVPLLACRVVSTAAALAVLRVRWGALRGAARPDVRLAVAAGAFDGLANVAFLVAVRSGSLVVVAVIAALYPGATVLLARRVLGERLTAVQLAGLAVAAAAVTILAVGSPGLAVLVTAASGAAWVATRGARPWPRLAGAGGPPPRRAGTAARR